MSKSKKISGAALIDKNMPEKNVKNLGNLQQKNHAKDLAKIKESEVAASSDHRDNQFFSHANSNRGK